MGNLVGKQTLQFANSVFVSSTATIAGPMEGAGLLNERIDKIMPDNLNGLSSWERTESYMLEWTMRAALAKEGSTLNDVNCVLAGDLLNQLMSTHFAVRSLSLPFLGMYGACSTMAQSMLVGAVFIDGGFASKIVAAVSSHHDAAERQYRFPTELGVQRPPVAQWTVTGSCAAVLSKHGTGPRISQATIGKVVDYGIKDPNAMGPAMAPAAADTIYQHFLDTGTTPAAYDRIFTGDLGSVGKELLIQLMQERNIDIREKYEDCGCMIYRENQDAHAGASGCASSGLVFGSLLHPLLCQGMWQRILFIGTGSLHSTTSYQQKESIPCIAHAVALEA